MKEKVRNMKMPLFSLFGKSRSVVLLCLGLFFLNGLQAQSLQEENRKLEKQTNKLLRTAEENLANDDFSSAEASYRQAISKSPESVKARYNMANMYYGKEKAAQSVTRLTKAAKIAETKEEKHKIFHNLGNSYMKQKKYKEAVEAYKNALRNNPKDEETRYNYALAKKMLEEEEQKGGGDDNKEQEDQDKQEKDKGDEGEKEQDKEDGEDKEGNGGDQKEDQKKPEDEDEKGKPDPKEGENKPGEEQPRQPQQLRPGQLSPQQIKSLLEAMNNEEKKVQDKINAEKAKGTKTRTEKDW